jgi:hypothetical protein
MGESARAACVVGWPVRHSRSPVIHGHWIKQYRLDALYRCEEIAPEAFADFLAHLAERGYVGANITIPHKEAALAMSEPDDRAQAVGAANTLWFDRGRLLSTNTDVEGFTANLDACVPGWEKRVGEAVVLGAGGSARAIIYGLIERGIGKINVVNRTPERAQALQALFGPAVQPAHWATLPHLFARHDWPAAARRRSRSAAPSRRGQRPGLCPAGNAAAGGGPGPGARGRRRAWHAAVPGGSGLPDVVWGAPGGYAAIACVGRDRPPEIREYRPPAGVLPARPKSIQQPRRHRPVAIFKEEWLCTK